MLGLDDIPEQKPSQETFNALVINPVQVSENTPCNTYSFICIQCNILVISFY